MLQVDPVQGRQAAVMAVKADHNHTGVVVEAAAGVVVVLAVLAGSPSEDYIALVVDTFVVDLGNQLVVPGHIQDIVKC